MVKPPTSPGPGAYKLPPVIGYRQHDKSRWINPAYKIGLALGKDRPSISPGPKYMTRDMTRFGKGNPPAYTIKSRHPRKSRDVLPGPGAYSLDKYDNKYKKAFSFGVRHPDAKPPVGPGPAEYNLRKKYPPGPAWSMGLAHRPKKADVSPGSAAYDTRRDLKDIRPNIKLTGRPAPLGFKSFGPGPSHKVDYNIGRRSPKFAFGVRTDQQPYIVPEDNACTYT